MEKIFYMDKDKFPSSLAAVKSILATHFKITAPQIVKTENGKPFLQNTNTRLFFSVSHTKEKLFIAFSDENVGIDAESYDRAIHLPLLLKKFPLDERNEIFSEQDFLRHWTIKESAVKWLGGTLAHDLSKLSYVNDRLYYEGLEIPAHVSSKKFDNFIVSVCSERDFSQTNFIYYTTQE